MRITHTADDRRRPLKARGAAIDRELPLAVEYDEHLLNGVVKVVPDAAARGNLAAVQEIEMRPIAPRFNNTTKAMLPAPAWTAVSGRYLVASVGTMRDARGGGCAAGCPAVSATASAVMASPAPERRIG